MDYAGLDNEFYIFILRSLKNSSKSQPGQLQVANPVNRYEQADEQDRIDHKVCISRPHYAILMNEKISKPYTEQGTEHRKNNDDPILFVVV